MAEMDIHARVLQYLEKTHPYQIRNEAEFLLIDAGKEIARLRDFLSRERDAHNRTRERWTTAHQSGTNEARANLLPQIEHLRAALSREQIAHDETRRVRNRARLDGIAEARANLTPEIERLSGMIEEIQGKHWPATPDQVRSLLGNRCAAVRYALPVPDGATEAPPHEGDTYTASAHDIITANWAAMDQRAVDLEEIERLKIEAAGYRLLRRGQHWSVIDGVGQTMRGEKLDAAVAAVKGET